MGTDEFLILAQGFDRLSKKFPPGCPALKGKASKNNDRFVNIIDFGVAEGAPRQSEAKGGNKKPGASVTSARTLELTIAQPVYASACITLG